MGEGINMISMIYSYLANVELGDMQKYISIALTIIDILVSAVIIFKFFKSKGKSGTEILESIKKGISSIAKQFNINSISDAIDVIKEIDSKIKGDNGNKNESERDENSSGKSL